MKTLSALLLMCAFLLPAFAAKNQKEEDRVKEAGQVLKEILNIPDNIPQDLLDKAECLIILPSVKKGAFGIGGSYGRGVMICRSGGHYTGRWGAPAMYALEGINIGFQLGGQATDFVLLVMNPKGAQSLLGSKVKLGADAAAAAGPKGRNPTAATDVVMKAEILSYSRSKGLFAGISLEDLYAALGWQRQRKTIWTKADGERNHPRWQGESPSQCERTCRALGQEEPQEPLRSQVAGITLSDRVLV